MERKFQGWENPEAIKKEKNLEIQSIKEKMSNMRKEKDRFQKELREERQNVKYKDKEMKLY